LELSVGFVQVPVQLTATNQEIDLNVHIRHNSLTSSRSMMWTVTLSPFVAQDVACVDVVVW
jgi:hypothetical protein